MPTATATSTTSPDPLAVLRRKPPHGRRLIVDAIREAETATGTRLWCPPEIGRTGWISQHAIYRAIATKRLAATRLGKGRFVVTDADLRAFLAARERG